MEAQVKFAHCLFPQAIRGPCQWHCCKFTGQFLLHFAPPPHLIASNTASAGLPARRFAGIVSFVTIITCDLLLGSIYFSGLSSQIWLPSASHDLLVTTHDIGAITCTSAVIPHSHFLRLQLLPNVAMRQPKRTKYVHQPLQSQRNIRVLDLLPGHADSALRCEI